MLFFVLLHYWIEWKEEEEYFHSSTYENSRDYDLYAGGSFRCRSWVCYFELHGLQKWGNIWKWFELLTAWFVLIIWYDLHISSGPRIHGWGANKFYSRAAIWISSTILNTNLLLYLLVPVLWTHVLHVKQELLQFVLEHVEDKNVEPLLEVCEIFWTIILLPALPFVIHYLFW